MNHTDNDDPQFVLSEVFLSRFELLNFGSHVDSHALHDYTPSETHHCKNKLVFLTTEWLP